MNRRWFVDYVLGRAGGDGRLRVLDFGCGEGEVVALLRERGIDAHGADVFYEGDTWQAARLQQLLHDGVVHHIGEDGRLPFDDSSFDLVISDQVLEHVERLEAVIAEVDRVLVPGGVSYHHFPTRDTLREVHMGIPLAHRLPARLRFAWTYALRRAGLGKHKDERPDPAEWARWKLDWIDRYCFYRSNREFERVLGRDHALVHREVEYCRFRAQHQPALRRLLAARALEPLLRRTFQRLGFTSLELHDR